MSTVPGIKSQRSLKVTDILQLILKAKIRSDTKKWQKPCGISPSSLKSGTIRFSRKLSNTSIKTRIHPRDALIIAFISAMIISQVGRFLETNSILHPKEHAPSLSLIPSVQTLHSISPNSQPLCSPMLAKPKPFSRWKYFRDGRTLQIIL